MSIETKAPEGDSKPEEINLNLGVFTIGNTGEVSDVIKLSDEEQDAAAEKLVLAVTKEWEKPGEDVNILVITKEILRNLTPNELMFYTIKGMHHFIEGVCEDFAQAERKQHIAEMLLKAGDKEKLNILKEMFNQN